MNMKIGLIWAIGKVTGDVTARATSLMDQHYRRTIKHPLPVPLKNPHIMTSTMTTKGTIGTLAREMDLKRKALGGSCRMLFDFTELTRLI